MKVRRIRVLAVVLPLMLLGGCASLAPPPVSPQDQVRRPYISEIELPEAKAYFGYARFRMLIMDNRWDEAISALEHALAFDPESEWLQLTLAKAYLHNQQLEEGGQTLETLLQLFPDQTDGWELIGELRFFQKRYPEAIAAYRTLLKKTPADETLRLRLIAVYDQQGGIQKAIAETKTLLKLNPDSLPGQLTLARLQRRNQQPQAATRTYRELLLRRPGQVQTILELGQLLEKEQQVDEAIDLYRESLRDNPELLAVYKQLARILILQERYDEALDLLRQAHQQRPEDVQILNRIGLLQLSLEDYAGGEQSFREVLKLQPDDPRHLYSLSMALIGQQRLDDALKILEQIPQDSKVYDEAVLQLGYLYRQQGDVERGIRVLQQVLTTGSPTVNVYYYLSAFLGEVGRFAEAGQIVRQGIEAYPRDVKLHYQQGVIFEQLQKRQQALQAMEEVLAIDPQNADALNFIAYHYAELGENLEQALKLAQQALKQKKSSYIYDTLGWIYYRMHRYDEARTHLEKAVVLDPDDALIQEHLGDVYLALQRWNDAEQVYRKSLELNHDSTTARNKLQRLLKDHPRQ